MVAANPVRTSETPMSSEGGAYVFPPSWQGLKQQVIYLAQFGDGIQVIEGVAGAGKSTFSYWLSEDPAGNVQSVISLPTAADAQHIFYELLEHLGLRPSASAGAGALLVMLRSYVQSLHRDGSRVVVLIDDAHLIADSDLAALISILPGEGESGQGLHLILMAEPGLAARIDQLQLLEIAVHDTTLPSLSPSEVEALLAKRASALAGASGNSEQARRIWSLTGGIPGRVLAQVSESMAALLPGEAGSDEPAISLRGWPIAHFIALIILCCILIWAFLVQRDESESADRRDVVSETLAPESSGVITRAETANPAAPVVTVVDIDAAVAEPLNDTVDPDRSRQSGTGGAASMSNANDTLSVTQKNLTNQEPTVAELDPALASEAESVTDEQQTDEFADGKQEAAEAAEVTDVGESVQEATVSDKPEISASDELRRQVSGGGLKGADVVGGSETKLLNFPGSAYVLQLMASSAPESLIEFYESQPNRDNLMIYRAERNGRIMHILVEGFYADKAAAVAAIANLPDMQKKGGPWPKRIQQIQQDINAVKRR